MDNISLLIRKIAPELVKIMEERYNILRELQFSKQPVGRRTLAVKINQKERLLRREAKFLEKQGLIVIKQSGMVLSEEGEGILDALEHFLSCLKGLDLIAREVERRFGYRRVLITPGDADVEDRVKMQMGRLAAEYLLEILKPGMVIAVTGGTTMAVIPECMKQMIPPLDVMVVPGRGALGERVEIQADTIAAKLAQKLGGDYRLLHIPENLGTEAMETITGVPSIKELLKTIKNADVLLHGIGRAEEMAGRRGFKERDIKLLKERGAVSETLGFYFNKKGQIVHSTTSIGLNLEDLKRIRHKITVAGGSSKGEAILSFSRNKYHDVLITDEGAARTIMKIIKEDDRDEKKDH